MAIRPKAVAVIRRGDEVLLSFARDPETGDRYARLLGGGIEFGERAEDTVRRELREEIGVEIADVRKLGVLENMFTHDGRDHHEIIFVFEASFADPAMYARASFVVDEAVCDGPAEWVSLARVRSRELVFYPVELIALLDESLPRRSTVARS